MMETVGPKAGSTLGLLLLLAAAVAATESPPRQLNTENILINVTAGTLSDSQLQDANYLQIKLNISVGEEQVLVNDFPVELSGVTRLTCQALLLDRLNGSSSLEAADFEEAGDSVSTVTRVMVSQNRVYSDLAEVVALQVFSEVIEVEGKEVQQPDMCEVKILMSPDFQKLAQFTNIYPMGRSEIFRLPREKDVLVTHPPSPRRAEEQLVYHTTSQYPLKHSETTQEEVAAPGKLPETPLRMDPDLLYELKYDDEFEDRQAGQSDHIQMETPPKETSSSYSALCRWVDEARERLKRFSAESLPLFFLIMWVVVIGVVGSAVIVRILDIIFPACEQKNVFHLNLTAAAAAASVDEEKHTLLENMEVEVEVEDKEQEEKKP